MTTNLDQEALDHTARCLQTIQHSAGAMAALLSQAANSLPAPLHQHFVEHYARIVEASGAAYQSVVYGMGAQPPGLRVGRDTLRLDQLNTPASQRLLRALQEAQKAAQALDEERGWVDEDGYGIGWAETIGGWEIGLRREVMGAEGSGRE
jgi:hypothetical protein